MARRTCALRIHHMTDPSTTPIHGYSPFGWHYLNPGNIDRPRLNNRNFGLPWHGHRHQANFDVKVDISKLMHPCFRLALEPLLERMTLRSESPESVLKEYVRVGPKLPDRERHALLAKLAEFVALQRKSFDALLELWNEDAAKHYMSPDALSAPPLALATGMLWAACEAEAPEWKRFFEFSKQGQWNTTPQYSPTLWSKILRCAGRLKDQNSVVEVLSECIDVRTHLEGLQGADLVHALNCITDDVPFRLLHELLLTLPSKTIGNLHAAYLKLRVTGAVPDNDRMFYHVHWQFRIRRPMHFLPRRQYFDHFPSVAVEALGRSNAPTEDLLKQRVQQWKDEGVLPQDYNYEIKVHDSVASLKEINKKQPWRRTKPKLPKHMDPRAKAG